MSEEACLVAYPFGLGGLVALSTNPTFGIRGLCHRSPPKLCDVYYPHPTAHLRTLAFQVLRPQSLPCISLWAPSQFMLTKTFYSLLSKNALQRFVAFSLCSFSFHVLHTQYFQ